MAGLNLNPKPTGVVYFCHSGCCEFADTGETREPKEGEWYLATDGKGWLYAGYGDVGQQKILRLVRSESLT